MPSRPLQRFTALAEPMELRWTVVHLPFVPAEVWPVRRGRRVRGTVNGIPFRSSLFPIRGSKHPMLLLNNALQKAAGIARGSRVRVEIEPDLEERPAELPEELARELRQDRALQRWYGALSEAMRREIGKWVAQPATVASRQRRAAQMAERLCLAMEGERELPPILRKIFQEYPLAESGWLRLTATQRRNHLLGIFYYQSVETQERRARKAAEEAQGAARKKSAP